jgi:hypothetical protein
MAQSPRIGAHRRALTIFSGVGITALVAGSVLLTGASAQADPPPQTVTFTSDGTWTVPAGVASLSVNAVGAAGGAGGGSTGGAGGFGESITGFLDVSAGDVLHITVGQQGQDAYRLESGDAGYDATGDSDHSGGGGGAGWTTGGAGGHGSLLARDGGGGGGSTGIVVNSDTADVAVAGGGAGGGGRGVFAFCPGGAGGASGEDGVTPGIPIGDPEFNLPCLAAGEGGLANDAGDANGGDGGSVIFLGGGGGGGGAGYFGGGLAAGSGGGAGSLPILASNDPGFPAGAPDGSVGETAGDVIGLGAGGGGGGGGSTNDGLLHGVTSTTADNAAGSVTLTYFNNPTTTTVAVDPASPVFGDDLAFTITVAQSSGPDAPVGSVSLRVDGQFEAAGSLTNGQATFHFDGGDFEGGVHDLAVNYSPDPDSAFLASSGVGSLTIAPAATTTTVTVDPASVVLGKSTHLKAVVNHDDTLVEPTGDVTFTSGSTVLGTAHVDENGEAHLDITPAAAGTLPIVATYSGDVNWAASSSAAVSLAVTVPLTPITPASLPDTGSQVGLILPWAIGIVVLGLIVAGIGYWLRARSRRRASGH